MLRSMGQSKSQRQRGWEVKGAAQVCECGKIGLLGPVQWIHVGKQGCEAGAVHCSRLSRMKRGGSYVQVENTTGPAARTCG